MFAVYSDIGAMRWVGDGSAITREECARWIAITRRNYATRGYGMFAVARRSDCRIIGFCGIVHPNNQVLPELKYAFLRDVWGQGHASELVPGLIAYGFVSHGLTRMIATVAPENLASRRVLAKASLRETETLEDGTLVYEWASAEAPPARTAGS